MKSRAFGRDSFQTSEVGLGTWQLGADWGEVTEDRALDILNAAVDQGVNFLDTADVYGLGRSETIIGKFLQSRSEEIFVATKLGRFPEPGWPSNFEASAIRTHTEASLKRLGVDSLDLTQLHCIPTEEFRKGEVFDHLRALQSEGKIRRFGASVESMEEAKLCLAQEGLASLQVIFNIFRQKPIEALFDEAKAKGIAIIVRLPVASGLLSGKFTSETTFADDDHRNYNRDGDAFNVGETFAGLPFAKGVALADQVRARLPADRKMAQSAIRWCLDHDAVSVVIPGASRVEQVADNTAVSEQTPLDPAIHESLKDLYETEVRDHIRGPY